jgi:hypothetical protein
MLGERESGGQDPRGCRTIRSGLLALGICAALGAGLPAARADEGGISFWLPGQFGSLAAVPTDPGFSLPVIYYHSSADATTAPPTRTAGGTS